MILKEFLFVRLWKNVLGSCSLSCAGVALVVVTLEFVVLLDVLCLHKV